MRIKWAGSEFRTLTLSIVSTVARPNLAKSMGPYLSGLCFIEFCLVFLCLFNTHVYAQTLECRNLFYPKSEWDLKAARLETDKFEIISSVDPETQIATEALIDSFSKSYGQDAFRVILTGNARGKIGIIGDLPPQIAAVFNAHLTKLSEYFTARFPKKKIFFNSAEIRISDDGHFDVAHLHLDYGGFGDSTYSTSTNFNSSGVGTLVASSNNIVKISESKNPENLLPLEYRDANKNWAPVPDYGVDPLHLKQLEVGETLIINRSRGGGITSERRIDGRDGIEAQRRAIFESGPWHASPALLPVTKPRRFWIGVVISVE